MENLSSPIVTVLIILGVIALFYLISVQVKNQREAREARNNPRSHNVNETNYNISHEGIDEHRLPGGERGTLGPVKTGKDKNQLSTTDEDFPKDKSKS
jgi:hypothetical protein